MATEHAIHPYCDLFPDLPKDELQALADDIYANGQQIPIYRWNKQIIDGKNRFKACQLAGVTPLFEAWSPTKPHDDEATDAEIWAFARSMNLHRRQLTASQYAVIAAFKCNMKAGQNQHTAFSESSKTPTQSKKEVGSMDPTSMKDAAKELGVSRESVKRAAKVIEHGSKPLVEAVRNGEVTIRDAEKVAKLPKAEQNKAVKAVLSGEAPTVAKAAGIDPEADRAAAIMASQRSVGPTPDEDGPDRTQKPKTPPAVTSNGNLGLFDAGDQRAWRDAYGVLHRLMAKGLKADFKKFGLIDRHLAEFYKTWTASNPGKWS